MPSPRGSLRFGLAHVTSAWLRWARARIAGGNAELAYRRGEGPAARLAHFGLTVTPLLVDSPLRRRCAAI
ncbi:hypothetical protein [Pandoraea sputorum]|uniref:hypothetical protein n=1 Tax=Pandoraea sputorum TaxID=93222 RepID=UPI00123FB6FA|nr:hypothetical protein [Pandoraea sputorum]